MMKDDQQQLLEIHNDERWLQDRLADTESPPTTEQIRRWKTATRIAVDEQWLHRRVANGTPDELAARVKAGLRSELAKAGATTGHRGDQSARRRWVFPLVATGTIAAAAAVVFLVSTYKQVTEPKALVDEYEFLDVLTEFEKSELGTSLDELASEIDDLEAALSHAGSSFGFHSDLNEFFSDVG